MLFGLIPTVFANTGATSTGGQTNQVSPCNAGQGNISLGDCLKLSDGTNVSDVYSTPAFFVNLIVRNLFVLAGVICFLLVIYGGFKFITGGQKGADEAKGIATAAVVGFIVMFSAYWIVQIIGLLIGMEIVL